MHKSWHRKFFGFQNQWPKFILESVNLMWWIYSQKSVCRWRQDTHSGVRTEVFIGCSVFHQSHFSTLGRGTFTIAVPISLLLASSILQPLVSLLASRISQNLCFWWTQMFYWSSELLLWWPCSPFLAPPLFYWAFLKLWGWVRNHPAPWWLWWHKQLWACCLGRSLRDPSSTAEFFAVKPFWKGEFRGKYGTVVVLQNSFHVA